MTRLFLLACVATACTPAEVRTRRGPAEVIAQVAARLAENEIPIDAAGRTTNRLRTAHFCFQGPDREGRVWEPAFARPSPGPMGFSVDGSQSEQDAARARCPSLFRVEIEAGPAADGGAVARVTSEWWRVSPAACAPLGNPLLGLHRCAYTYTGATEAANAERYFQGLLSGL